MALCTYKVTMYSPAIATPPSVQCIVYPQWNVDPGTHGVLDWAKAQAIDLFGTANCAIIIEADRSAT